MLVLTRHSIVNGAIRDGDVAKKAAVGMFRRDRERRGLIACCGDVEYQFVDFQCSFAANVKNSSF